MNVVEELQNLDINDVGRWPITFRAAVIAIVFVVVVGFGIYWFIVEDKALAVCATGSPSRSLSPRHFLQSVMNRHARYGDRTYFPSHEFSQPPHLKWGALMVGPFQLSLTG